MISQSIRQPKNVGQVCFDRAAERRDARWDRNWKILMDTVLNEDFLVARTIHRNNLAGTRDSAVFGRQEAALQHFHAELEKEISGQVDHRQ